MRNSKLRWKTFGLFITIPTFGPQRKNKYTQSFRLRSFLPGTVLTMALTEASRASWISSIFPPPPFFFSPFLFWICWNAFSFEILWIPTRFCWSDHSDSKNTQRNTIFELSSRDVHRNLPLKVHSNLPRSISSVIQNTAADSAKLTVGVSKFGREENNFTAADTALTEIKRCLYNFNNRLPHFSHSTTQHNTTQHNTTQHNTTEYMEVLNIT